MPYAVWLHHRVDSCPTEIDAAVTATAAAYREDLKYQRLAAEADRRVVETERDAYKRESDRAFYEHPLFWAAASLAAFIGGVFAGREMVRVVPNDEP